MGIASFFNAPLARLFFRRAPEAVDVWEGVDLEAMLRRTPLENELLAANDDWPGAGVSAPANDSGRSAPE